MHSFDPFKEENEIILLYMYCQACSNHRANMHQTLLIFKPCYEVNLLEFLAYNSQPLYKCRKSRQLIFYCEYWLKADKFWTMKNNYFSAPYFKKTDPLLHQNLNYSTVLITLSPISILKESNEYFLPQHSNASLILPRSALLKVVMRSLIS